MSDKPKIPSPDDIARQLLSVQPMSNNTFKNVYEAAKTQEELEAEGYKPVSSMGLMWVKDEKDD